mgnify:CR=1 FL=1
MSAFLLACLLAIAIGAVTARLMRVAGLVLVLAVLVMGGIAGVMTDLRHPTLLETLVLMALVQAGYLAGTLMWPAPRSRGEARTPLASEDDRAAG